MFEKLGEVEAEYDAVTRRLEQLRAELAALHHQQGSVASYADAARQLGVSRARISQILNLLNLLNLPPRVQQGLLLGDLHLSERRVSERRVSEVVARVEW